jgi:hypothetical protein
VIQHFLEDVEENGHYVGFCSLGLSCQQLENAQLRDHLGMRPGMTGVLVNRVQRLTDSHNHIRKDDVLMAFDGVPIANDGTGGRIEEIRKRVLGGVRCSDDITCSVTRASNEILVVVGC